MRNKNAAQIWNILNLLWFLFCKGKQVLMSVRACVLARVCTVWLAACFFCQFDFYEILFEVYTIGDCNQIPHLHILISYHLWWYSSVSIVTGQSVFDSRQGQIFALRLQRPGRLGGSFCPVCTGVLSQGVKRKANDSPPYSAQVKEAWMFTSSTPYAFIAWCFLKQRYSILTYLSAATVK